MDYSETWEDIARLMCSEISADFMKEQLHVFSGGQGHEAGSEYNNNLADYIESQWHLWGWPSVRRQEFFLHLPTGPQIDGPWNEVVVTNNDGSQIRHTCKTYVEGKSNLKSSPLPAESTFKLPAYQAYSCSGEAYGQFVFVNYARPKDLIVFDNANHRNPNEPSLLCNQNVIAIARLKKTTLKSQVESLMGHCHCGPCGLPNPEHHPGALILYPDPEDVIGPAEHVYPNGSGLPGDAPVFGNVNMANIGGGNPNKPNHPTMPYIYETNALVPGKALTPIPVQPIGYDDAKIILSFLDGPTVPDAWSKSLATHIGPSNKSKLKVIVRNHISEHPKKCVNIIGVMPGDLQSDEMDHYVIFGNHRDAWVQGACDPGSGTVILQQIACILGSAYRKGFRPRRSLIVASWDCEEFSLIGSTHFTELFKYELASRAIAYINADCPVKGNQIFNVRTDQLLTEAVIKASKLIELDSPVSSKSLFDKWIRNVEDGQPKISSLGGGSDHIPFEYKLGIPSVYPEFMPNEGLYTLPVYHTAYDTIDVVERFTDPPSSSTGPLPTHRLIAKLILTLIIELLCASRLPLSPLRLAKTLNYEWTKLEEKIKREIPDIVSFEVELNFIDEAIINLKQVSEQFEKICCKVESKSEKFPSCLNRLIGRLSSHFVQLCNNPKTSLKNLILGVRGYQSIYFPHLVTAYTEFKSCLESHKDYSSELGYLKEELSNLANCLYQTSHWLENGLIGFDAFV